MTSHVSAGRSFLKLAGIAAAMLSFAVVAAVLWRIPRDSGKPVPAPRKPVAATFSHPAHPPIRPTPPPTDGYVGSQACAKCHDEIARQFAAHPMGRSSSEVPTDDDPETYGPETMFQPSGRRKYWVERQGDTVLHHEIMVDAEGETIYDQAAPVQYAIGSGTRGKTYLVNRDGVLFVSPISWYANGARWDLSPGYAPDDHPRFERRAPKECLLCHSGRIRQRPGQQDIFEPDVFEEITIGCERCHGPGRAHIAAQESSNPPQPDLSIVNPASLPHALRDDVCNQCHLQGLASVPRYGRSFMDFRPGDEMAGCWSTLLAGTGVRDSGDTKAVSQVQQMLASGCYKNSEGKLGCISCHDAHSTPSAAEKIGFYRQRCLTCHEAQGCALPAEKREAQSNSCIDCHMPRLSAHDVAHASQTDHRIPRRLEEDLPPDELNGPSGELEFFAHEESGLEPWEIYRARGIARIKTSSGSFMGGADIREATEWLKEVVKIAPDDVPALESLGSACIVLRNEAEARDYLERVLKLEPDHENALALLTVACYQSGDYQAGLEYVDRLQKINPWVSLNYARQAEMLGRFRQMRPAIEAGLRGLELDPTQTTLRAWLIEAYQSVGDRQAALLELQTLKRIESR